MELTSEQKAKVFAKYLGCKVLDLNKKETEILQGINFMFGEHHATFEPTGRYALPISECLLVLRTTNQLEYEEYLQVGSLLGFKSSISSNGDAFVRNIFKESPLPFHCLNTKFVFDFLTMAGIAVPLFIAPGHEDNGKNAIQLGLAIAAN